MDEVAGILIAVGSLFVGLLVLGWACGDFSAPKASSRPSEEGRGSPPSEEPKPEAPAPPSSTP